MKKLGRSLLPALLLLCFLLGLSRLETARRTEGRERLEQTLRRAAVACYALDGAYPASLEDIQARFGLDWDETAYVIHYEIFASNLAPDITVMEKQP